MRLVMAVSTWEHRRIGFVVEHELTLYSLAYLKYYLIGYSKNAVIGFHS